MKPAPKPSYEERRLRSLVDHAILDTDPEPVFDDLTALAAFVCGVPYAAVSFIDADRQWFKSRHNFSVTETPRDQAFCAYVVSDGGAMTVCDVNRDPRFIHHGIVLDGEDLQFYAGHPVVDGDGLPLGTLCVLDTQPHDMSDEQLGMLAALARQVSAQLTLRREIVARKRLEAVKDEFISTVSHELRTPLTSIRGALGLVVGGALGDLPPTFASMLEIAANNADRLVRLINDILDIEKMTSGRASLRREPVDLIEIVQRAVQENQAYAQRFDVSFSFDYDEDEVWVLGDPDRLRQVVDNLLSNAAKYAPKGSVVYVTLTGKNHTAQVSVADSGSGIPLDFRDQIFGRFAQADSSDTRRRGGTGLGLAIAKQIVEDHGGTIDFTSEPGEGATFTFTIPTAATPVSTIDRAPPEARVLIVEDDLDTAVTVSMVLQSADYVTSVAHTAGEAIRALDRTEFAAITLDLGLPDRDGLSLIRHIRERSKLNTETPIVVVSGTEDRRTSSSTSVSNTNPLWLVKPVEPQTLIQRVNEVTRATFRRDGAPCVLHVEDDKDLASVVATCLAGVAAVHNAPSLDAAHNRIHTFNYDLVVLDLALPDGKGETLIRTLEHTMPNTPVIIFSAREISADTFPNVRAAFVKSNHTEDDLVKAVRRALDAAQS